MMRADMNDLCDYPSDRIKRELDPGSDAEKKLALPWIKLMFWSIAEGSKERSPFLHCSTTRMAAQRWAIGSRTRRGTQEDNSIMVKIDLWAWYQSGEMPDEGIIDISTQANLRKVFKKGPTAYGDDIHDHWHLIAQTNDCKELMLKWRGTVPTKHIAVINEDSGAFIGELDDFVQYAKRRGNLSHAQYIQAKASIERQAALLEQAGLKGAVAKAVSAANAKAMNPAGAKAMIPAKSTAVKSHTAAKSPPGSQPRLAQAAPTPGLQWKAIPPGAQFIDRKAPVHPPPPKTPVPAKAPVPATPCKPKPVDETVLEVHPMPEMPSVDVMVSKIENKIQNGEPVDKPQDTPVSKEHVTKSVKIYEDELAVQAETAQMSITADPQLRIIIEQESKINQVLNQTQDELQLKQQAWAQQKVADVLQVKQQAHALDLAQAQVHPVGMPSSSGLKRHSDHLSSDAEPPLKQATVISETTPDTGKPCGSQQRPGKGMVAVDLSESDDEDLEPQQQSDVAAEKVTNACPAEPQVAKATAPDIAKAATPPV